MNAKTFAPPPPPPSPEFRNHLTTALLFFAVSVVVLGFLMIFVARGALSTELDAAESLERIENDWRQSWDVNPGVPPQSYRPSTVRIEHVMFPFLLTCLLAPLVGLTFEPLLQHLATRRNVPINGLIVTLTSLPLWFIAYLPTLMITRIDVPMPGRMYLYISLLLCTVMTGILHHLKVRFTWQHRAYGGAPVPPPPPRPH